MPEDNNKEQTSIEEARQSVMSGIGEHIKMLDGIIKEKDAEIARLKQIIQTNSLRN